MSTKVRAGAPAETFERQFQSRLDKIQERGKAAGLTLTDICRLAGIARATPDRWRKQTPLSVTLVDKMESVVESAEKTKH